MTTHVPKNTKPAEPAAVEAIALEIEELIIDGQILTADKAVLLECARRYVEIEHAKRNRKSARNVEALQKTKAERSEKLRARIASITSALAEEIRADGPPSQSRLETVVSDLINLPKETR